MNEPSAGPRFGRRNLLKLGLAIGGAGVLGASSLGWAVFHLRPTAPGRSVLSDEEAAFLTAVGEALFPPGNALKVDVHQLKVTDRIDAHLAFLHAREQRAARAVLAAIDWWPRLSFQSTRRFAALALDERIVVLDHWDESPHEERRAVPSLLRLMVGLHVFDEPAVLAAMGHEFGCTPDPVVPSDPVPPLPADPPDGLPDDAQELGREGSAP